MSIYWGSLYNSKHLEGMRKELPINSQLATMSFLYCQLPAVQSTSERAPESKYNNVPSPSLTDVLVKITKHSNLPQCLLLCSVVPDVDKIQIRPFLLRLPCPTPPSSSSTPHTMTTIIIPHPLFTALNPMVFGSEMLRISTTTAITKPPILKPPSAPA